MSDKVNKDPATIAANPAPVAQTIQVVHEDHYKKVEAEKQAIIIDKTKQKPFVQSEWYRRLNIDKNIEIQQPQKTYIDVQSDSRAPLTYIIFFTMKHFNELPREVQSEVSLFSMIAYNIIIFNTFVLLQDMTHRIPRTEHTEEYQRDYLKSDYYTQILNSYVSQDMADLLQEVAAYEDAMNQNITFIPSFSATSFLHDFGRLALPQIFIEMHNHFATMKVATHSEELKRQFHDKIIMTVNETIYRVSNFIGGLFQAVDGPATPKTWFNELIDSVFNPALGRAHQRRPTFRVINIIPLVTQAEILNPYDLLTGYTDRNQASMTHFVKQMSITYEKEGNFRAIPLHLIQAKAKGMTVLSHTIEQATLPTWHLHPRPNVPIKEGERALVLTNAQFAAASKFMIPIPVGKTKVPTGHVRNCATCTIPDELLRIKCAKATADSGPIEFKLFDESRDTTPDVYIYQPYETSKARSKIAMSLGYKIESEEFDALALPLINPDDTLLENSDTHKVGTIPIEQIQPVLMHNSNPAAIYIIERRTHSNEILAFAHRDGGQVILPVYDNEDINIPQRNERWLPAHDLEERHNHQNLIYTWTAWREEDDYNALLRHRYLWSSYRYIERKERNSSIHFYHTLEGLYGKNIPVRRNRNPVLQFPQI